jgi:(2Fe-2S) ferredoxin
MGPFEKHVFVCTSGKACPGDGPATAILIRLRDLVAEAGLKAKIRISHAGCMDQCGHGPMAVVYPENVWYGGLKAEDADVIFSEHLVGGRPVERLIYTPANPGTNKTEKYTKK